MSLGPKRLILPGRSTGVPFRIALCLLLCTMPGLSQKAQPEDSSLPKYDLHTETKTKGIVDEVNLLPVGTRKDFTELVFKNGAGFNQLTRGAGQSRLIRLLARG